MFDSEEFSKILKKIVSKYNSITELANESEVGRSYISKYIHKGVNAPPTPKVLNKLAVASKGATTYSELMEVCGYSTHLKINLTPTWYVRNFELFEYQINKMNEIISISRETIRELKKWLNITREQGNLADTLIKCKRLKDEKILFRIYDYTNSKKLFKYILIQISKCLGIAWSNALLKKRVSEVEEYIIKRNEYSEKHKNDKRDLIDEIQKGMNEISKMNLSDFFKNNLGKLTTPGIVGSRKLFIFIS